MGNDNFWDWDNEETHRVSSVYRDVDDDAEDVTIQTDAPQNNTAQKKEVQNNIVQNEVMQNNGIQMESGQSTKTDMEVQKTQTKSGESQSVNVGQTKGISVETVPENNFILVDNPQAPAQNSIPQTDSPFVQTNDRQTQDRQPGYQFTQDYQQSGYQSAQGYQQAAHQTTEEYQQSGYQQANFQQIIPVQQTQQNQGTNRQKAGRNKNTDYSACFDKKDISENKVSAMAAYLMGPVGIIIALLMARDSAYAAFHVRQALKITICSIVLEIIAAILALFAIIPLVGIIFKLVLVIICVLWLGVLVLRLIAIAQVCDGEAREPVIIGKMNCFH